VIYIDNMGHCYSDTSLDELYEFCVTKLGLRPEWNHYSREFPHFDIRDRSYRDRVIALGAVAITNKEMVRLVRGGSSPYSNSNSQAIPLYQENFRGKQIMRVDFARYFAQRSLGV
jgi:Protein of unknown function (DUF4031)